MVKLPQGEKGQAFWLVAWTVENDVIRMRRVSRVAMVGFGGKNEEMSAKQDTQTHIHTYILLWLWPINYMDIYNWCKSKHFPTR